MDLESKNLINLLNENSTINANNLFDNTTATLEISSTTVIDHIGACQDNNRNLCNNIDNLIDFDKRNSTEAQMEYHFNPLYIISDRRNNEYYKHNQQNNNHHYRNSDYIYDHVNHQLFSAPPDRYGLIYMALLLAGIGFLLPYNSFIIAVDYFQQRFPNTTIIFDMSTTYIVIALITVIVQNFFVETVPLFRRLIVGYLLSNFFMILVTFYEIWANAGSYLDNLVLISIIAVGCTIQQSTFYGYTSMLPKRFD